MPEAYKLGAFGVFLNKRVSVGSQSGWVERLYDERAAPTLLYGRVLGLSHGEAEDVLHETFAALLSLAAAPEQPAHYLVRSYRNRAVNYRRGWWRRMARELEASRWFDPVEPEDPREQWLAEALADLPGDQREVIVLKIWHRLTFAGIGELLGLSPNTAAGRYRYGLERLRRVLKVKSDELDEIPDRAASLVEAAAAFRRT